MSCRQGRPTYGTLSLFGQGSEKTANASITLNASAKTRCSLRVVSASLAEVKPCITDIGTFDYLDHVLLAFLQELSPPPVPAAGATSTASQLSSIVERVLSAGQSTSQSGTAQASLPGGMPEIEVQIWGPVEAG